MHAIYGNKIIIQQSALSGLGVIFFRKNWWNVEKAKKEVNVEKKMFFHNPGIIYYGSILLEYNLVNLKSQD